MVHCLILVLLLVRCAQSPLGHRTYNLAACAMGGGRSQWNKPREAFLEYVWRYGFYGYGHTLICVRYKEGSLTPRLPFS